MIGGIELTQKGSSGIVVNNAEIQNYYSVSETIMPYTFVEFANGKIKPSINKIDGLTISSITPTNLGKVYILGSGN